jgi:hypothetical protein
MKLRLAAPGRGFVTAMLALMCAVSIPTYAQPRGKSDKNDRGGTAAKASGNGATERTQPDRPDRPDRIDRADRDKKPKEKTFDFNNLQLNGQLRTPQLLYFLERANEELERASLEKRSFIPHLVRSVEEEPL